MLPPGLESFDPLPFLTVGLALRCARCSLSCSCRTPPLRVWVCVGMIHAEKQTVNTNKQASKQACPALAWLCSCLAWGLGWLTSFRGDVELAIVVRPQVGTALPPRHMPLPCFSSKPFSLTPHFLAAPPRPARPQSTLDVCAVALLPQLAHELGHTIVAAVKKIKIGSS